MISAVKKIRKKIHNSELASKIFNALLGSAGVRILGMALGFFVGVQLARGLGTEAYGMYSLVMSLIALMTVPTEFGIPQLTVREVAKANAKGQWGSFKGLFIWSNWVVAIVFTLLLLGLLTLKWFEADGLIEAEFYHTMLYGIVLVPLISLMRIRGAALMGLQKIVTGQMPNIILRPLFFSLALFVYFNLLEYDVTPSKAMFLQLSAVALVFLIAVLLLKKYTPVNLSQIKAKIQARKWWSSSIPMALTEGMRVLQGHLALLILGFFISLNDVGVFKVAVSISALIAMPISLINIVSASIISDLYTKGEHRKLAKMATFMAILMVLGVSILILPFVFYGEELITWVFGIGYAKSATALLIIFIGLFVNAFFGLNATLLNMTKHEKRVSRSFLIALLVNIILALILIPFFEIYGAALANSLGLIVWNILMWYDAKNLLAINSAAWLSRNKNV
jgi:O-antigen/teichoic acid export membrane protein